MDSYSYIANADAAAIETLYQAYQQNPGIGGFWLAQVF